MLATTVIVWIMNIFGGSTATANQGRMAYKECEPGTKQNGFECPKCPVGFISQSLNSRQCNPVSS